MKKLAFFLILVIVQIQAFGSIETTDPVVMSKTGLKLRLNPELESPVLDIIEYGEKLEIVNDSISSYPFKVNWVEGKWVKVKFRNQEGYVFDGFLSELKAPNSVSELSPNLDGLSFALYNWAYNHYSLIDSDTLSESELAVTTLSKLGPHELFIHESESHFLLELSLEDIRIMDAYHLLECMMDDRTARSMLKENTMFFKGKDGKLEKIKIGLDEVLIQKMENGTVKIKAKSLYSNC